MSRTLDIKNPRAHVVLRGAVSAHLRSLQESLQHIEHPYVKGDVERDIVALAGILEQLDRRDV